ncbi:MULTISPECIES: TetR/AcrR family transcriptional regulator [unclassified Gordonia (in: high G+C Gram-positive bacteria)]|uniref:TetR/AcrR family transcriptional regulator n=1 Tax=unclassified Gordonia (in: high G+C Gram-positive bacteria) TaxID=2657482 RepID=UPI001F0EEA74|nr:helix-turn-helix domain-containing protein [Gordonia sp. ABSL49_1]MCH5645081.1 TetR/AcrR family transcriptional regulator [Gordonia sp. ABSL49_1]
MAYDNSSRTEAARATRARVLTAARTSFLDNGFGGTTIRHVAHEAQVSQETIYKSFAGKAGLLKAVYDTALVGDDEDVPLAQRPEALAVFNATSPDEMVLAYAKLAQSIGTRIDPLLRVVLSARDTDAALSSFAHTIDQERRNGSAMWVQTLHEKGWLRADLDVEKATDILWVLNSNEPRWLLRDRGWTADDIATWLADMLCHALLP